MKNGVLVVSLVSLFGACDSGGYCTLEELHRVCTECMGETNCDDNPQCIDGKWVIECYLPTRDAGVPDMVTACVPVDGGGVSSLTLTPGSPSACPCKFPQDGAPCAALVTCSYDFPVGTSPSGCLAQCDSTDAGNDAWSVPTCF
jgi:hypothetical protein